MDKPLSHAVWTIKLLSPVHIGNGQTLVQGFDFWPLYNRETVILDQERIWEQAIFGKGEALDLALLRRSPAELVRPEELQAGSAFVRYRLRGVPQGTEILAQIKDSFTRPYIPGSSLKGALRTVVLWELVRTGRVRVSEDTLGERKESAGRELEREAFGRDPNRDVWRVLRVGDSGPAGVDALHLVKAYAFGGGRGPGQRIPINVEAIGGGTELRAEVTIERYLFEQKVLGFDRIGALLERDLPATARAWAEARLEAEMAFYRMRGWDKPLDAVQRILTYCRGLRENEFLLQIGWATGWGSKTIGPLLEAPLRERVIVRYGLRRGRSGTSGSSAEGGVFPSGRQLAGATGPEGLRPGVPFGWLRVRVEEVV